MTLPVNLAQTNESARFAHKVYKRNTIVGRMRGGHDSPVAQL